MYVFVYDSVNRKIICRHRGKEVKMSDVPCSVLREIMECNHGLFVNGIWKTSV